ncbi:galactosyltransferase-domain-containing protein [Piptocephalis cylindrospora]|uniref:Galactosyltransferase-domain-containing protein n=1 Tax=Piptocephalis cylindrospora TaxID=1907219 RepID=A0A4P9Y3T7_9FUNG|nr:galactosyltransferase-domain-containing protein [Piptocephalis cylindrospora]|eukprot:RKP13587.1 galactosyltransferase-domain-containing protein [Piptocephalis cylindrospora]
MSLEPLPSPAGASSDPEPRSLAVSIKYRTLLILLTIISLISTTSLLRQESLPPHHASIDPIFAPQFGLSANTTAVLPELSDPSKVRFLLIVFSSWAEAGFRHRQTFRESTLRLIAPALNANPSASFAYRFVLGNAPSDQVRRELGPAIDAERHDHADILIVPTSDRYEDLSRKAYGAYTWAEDLQFDYLLKTDDDCFIRLDTIIHEHVASHPQYGYWRGMAYHDISPIRNSVDKNSAWDYLLPLFPPYVAGALTVLSRDVIHRLVSPGPRTFTKNEDQNLGIWLYPLGITPVHDRRIQQADVCEDDMISKHFSDTYDAPPNGHTPKDMADNVLQGRPLCQGFWQNHCAYCYPCTGRINHWRDWGFECDDVRGVTRPQPVLPPSSSETQSPSQSEVVDPPSPSEEAPLKGSWIIPGLLHPFYSPMSDREDWSSLYWAAWTSAPDTFLDRHHRTLELVFAHTPHAHVVILSPSLPTDFFLPYTSRGYNVYVVPATPADFLRNQWWIGPKTEAWVHRMHDWSTGTNYISHLTDYIRYIMLHKYGGTYMDMDALWIRAPPDPDVQFIGGDQSLVASDLEWTLDATGLYLAPGVMRLRKHWSILRQIAEDVFDPDVYSPECFNCVGPKAITTHVKPQRALLTRVGHLHILPIHILYPKNYLEAHLFLEPSVLPPNRAIEDPAMAEVSDLLHHGTWSIHLFGKMTKGVPIQPGSVVDAVFRRWGLYITGEHAGLRLPLEIHGPSFIEAPVGAANPILFQGTQAILVRGGEVILRPEEGGRTMLRVRAEGGWLSWGDASPDWKYMEMEGIEGSYAGVNSLLSQLRWARSDPDDAETKQPAGLIRIEVGMGEETVVYRCKVWTA